MECSTRSEMDEWQEHRLRIAGSTLSGVASRRRFHERAWSSLAVIDSSVDLLTKRRQRQGAAAVFELKTAD